MNNKSDSAASREELPEMDLFDHLRDLRKRSLYALLAVAALTLVSFNFSTDAFELLNAPFHQSFKDAVLIGTGPAEAFILRLKVSIFCGTLLALPILFYQLWAFVSPGLYSSERRLAIPFLFSSTFLFLIGVAFSFYVVLPFSYEFFLSQYEQIGVEPTIRISENLSLLLKALLGFGLVFQMPVLAYFLGRAGILTTDFIRRTFRYAVVIIFVISAVLTPPDVLTQFLMAGPMLLLYGISFLIVRAVERKADTLETT
jgi:sec-independent protein translocase protein TatC